MLKKKEVKEKEVKEEKTQAKMKEKVEEEVKAEGEKAKQEVKRKPSLEREKIIEAIKKMPALELSELVKELEEVFGVSAAQPAVVTPPTTAPGAPPTAPPVEEEKAQFNVVLATVGDKKIQVIKTVRNVTGLSLKEAKALVDEAPKPVKEKASKEEAEKIKAALEEAGATVELK